MSEDVPEPLACAVCGRVLESTNEDGVVCWGHLIFEVDHPAVPVPQSQIRTEFRCDFCDVVLPPTFWILPCASFKLPMAPGHGSAGDWSMCVDCKDCVTSHGWGRLATRQMAGERSGWKPPRVVFTTLLDAVRRNVQGPPYEVTRPEFPPPSP